jgi:hypothetical protein
MKHTHVMTLVCAMMLVFALGACVMIPSAPATTQTSPIATATTVSDAATAPVPEEGTATLAGQVFTTIGGDKPLTDTVVRLARVYWNEDRSDGAFVLEGATSPSAITDQDGQFTFHNLAAADYVIVVGDVMGQNVVVSESSGKPRIVTVATDETKNIGNIRVELPQP